LAGVLTPAFFLQTEKGARVLPFSAAGGMPAAMLAFPEGKIFCHSPQLLPFADMPPHSLDVARQSLLLVEV